MVQEQIIYYRVTTYMLMCICKTWKCEVLKRVRKN